MSRQQRDAIDAAPRAEPFNLKQATAEHRKPSGAFAIRPCPAHALVAVSIAALLFRLLTETTSRRGAARPDATTRARTHAQGS